MRLLIIATRCVYNLVTVTPFSIWQMPLVRVGISRRR